MTDVYIIGTTLPALVAALELAEVGLSVRVSADDSAVALAELNEGGELDPDGELARFLTHLAEPISEHGPGNPGALPVDRDPRPVQLRDAKGGWMLQPTPSVWGIPAVPMATRALAILGGGAATRASLDRVKPVLTIGKTHELGALVRNRMGRAVEERLVDPVVRERYGVAPDEVDVALAAPGFNEALTRAGSLSGAVLAYSERYVARETRVAPAAGWSALAAVLIERLKLYGAQFCDSPVETVGFDASRQSEGNGWLVRERSGQEFAVQAVVVDPAATLPEALAAPLAPLVPEAWRQQARVQIADPRLPDQDHDALQTVELDGLGCWSMRLERDSHSRWWAQLAGPRFNHSLQFRDLGGHNNEVEASARQLLEFAGLRAISEVQATVCVAPYVSAARRDAEIARLLAQREATPSLLPVGAALHGGDLAAAVSDARGAAVVLRRRLLGIAE